MRTGGRRNWDRLAYFNSSAPAVQTSITRNGPRHPQHSKGSRSRALSTRSLPWSESVNSKVDGYMMVRGNFFSRLLGGIGKGVEADALE